MADRTERVVSNKCLFLTVLSTSARGKSMYPVWVANPSVPCLREGVVFSPKY